MKTRGSCGIVAGKQVRYCSIWQVSYLDSYERHLCLPPVGAQIQADIFAVPWGHHKLLIDRLSVV